MRVIGEDLLASAHDLCRRRISPWTMSWFTSLIPTIRQERATELKSASGSKYSRGEESIDDLHRPAGDM